AGLGDGRLEAVVARGTGPAVPKYLTVVGAEHGHVLYRNKVGQDSASGIGWIGRIGGDLLSVRADQNGSEVSWVSVVVDGPVLAPNRIGTINDVGERQLRAADDHAAAGGARREHTDAVGVRGGPGVQRFNSIDAQVLQRIGSVDAAAGGAGLALEAAEVPEGIAKAIHIVIHLGYHFAATDHSLTGTGVGSGLRKRIRSDVGILARHPAHAECEIASESYGIRYAPLHGVVGARERFADEGVKPGIGGRPAARCRGEVTDVEASVEEIDRGRDRSSRSAAQGDSQVADVYVTNGQCGITEVSG